MPLIRIRLAGAMLRVALIALISLPGIDAAPPKRTCNALSYDAYAVDGSPTVLSLAFLGQTPFFVFDSGKSDPFLQFLPVTRTTRGCGAIDGGPVTQPRASFLGSQPMIAADFNGDGIPDAATVDFAANKVSIFLGDSTGALKPAASYTIGANPQSVAAADFNRDGKMDLVVADSGSGVSDPGSVAVLLGNGDGTFRSPAKFQAGAGPLALAVADINRDGNLDLVTVNERSGSVSTLLGRGDGSFQIQREVFIGQSPTSVVTADFNGDGLPDLAVTDVVSNSVTIMLGNGDGSYVPGTSYNTGDEPGYVAGADFNGDGKPDLAILFETTNTLSILLGNGDGSFSPPVNYMVGTSPGSIALADMDGDGVLDILAPDPSSHSILILWGRADGSFEAPPVYEVGSAPEAVVVADFNGDGIPDLVTPNLGSSDISVLLGSGDGKFRRLPNIRLGDPLADAVPRPAAIAVGDFNGDGALDLAIANGIPLNQVTILLGKGDGTFRIVGSFPTGADPRSVLVADFDGDGKLDVATANANRASNLDFGDLSILMGNGDGTFRAPVSYAAGVRPNAAVAADVNGDGNLDLIVAANGDTRTSQSETIAILLGNGDGGFQPAQYVVVGDNPPTAGTLASVTAADLDGDGKLDLVATGSSTIEILLGAGDGTFQRSAYPTSSQPRFVAVADIDGNGKLDVIVAHCCGAADMSYLQGNGDGTFQAEANFPGGASPVWAAIGDFNADGALDVAIADNLEKGSVVILLNRKAGPGAKQ